MSISSLADISNLGFYLRSDAGLFTTDVGSTVASSNTDPIGRWEDQSGGGYHVIQPTSGKRSTLLSSSSYKSKPAVKFTAASSQWLSNADFNLTSNPVGGTWVVAWQTDAISSSMAVVAPFNYSLGLQYDTGNVTFWRHGGGFEAGYYNSPHTHARLTICRYNSAGSGDAGKLRIRSNRINRTLSFFNPVSGISAGTAVGPSLFLGRYWAAETGLFDGIIFEVGYYTRTLNDAECDSIDSYFALNYFAQGNKKVFCIGDSLTEGYPITLGASSYPTKLATALGSGWTTQNNGIRAYKIADLAAIADAQIDIDKDDWRDRDIVIHQGGTNDFGAGNTVSQALADMTAEVTDRKATGFETYVCTIPPRGDLTSGTTPTAAGFESDRTAYNTAVRAGNTGADGVIDWAADSRLSNPANATYFYSGDLVHMEAAGNDVIVEITKSVIDPSNIIINTTGGFCALNNIAF